MMVYPASAMRRRRAAAGIASSYSTAIVRPPMFDGGAGVSARARHLQMIEMAESACFPT